MTLTANIELLIAHLKAEIAVLEARLQNVLHQVTAKAEAAGVDMPKASDPVPAPSTPIPADHPVAQAQQKSA